MRRWMIFGVVGVVLAAAAAILTRRDVSSPPQRRPHRQAEDLVALPKTKLYARAQREGIVGRSAMTKAELVEALCHHE